MLNAFQSLYYNIYAMLHDETTKARQECPCVQSGQDLRYLGLAKYSTGFGI